MSVIGNGRIRVIIEEVSNHYQYLESKNYKSA